MTTYAQRSKPAQAWELELVEKLRKAGWDAELWGQILLSDKWHNALREYRDSYGRPALIRWMPDIIAVRLDDMNSLTFIDAKTGSSERTGNHSVEINSHQAAKAFEAYFHIPVLFVWSDGALSTHDIENRHHSRRDGAGTNGSGTAFYLIDHTFATPLRDIFMRS